MGEMTGFFAGSCVMAKVRKLRRKGSGGFLHAYSFF
jgi:hypothetical protein